MSAKLQRDQDWADQLEAANAQARALRAEHDEWERSWATEHAENQRLQAENGQLHQQRIRLFDERDWLEAQAERLQRENGSLARTYAACEELLRSRTERLNQLEALEALVRTFAQTPVDDAEFGALYRQLVAWPS